MGAEVIKIEPPGAPDPLPHMGAGRARGPSFFWMRLHAAQQESRALKSARGRGPGAFLDLVDKSDIIVENFRPARWRSGTSVRRARERNRGSSCSRLRLRPRPEPEAHKGRIRLVAEAGERAEAHERVPRRPSPRARVVARRQPGRDGSRRRARWPRCTGARHRRRAVVDAAAERILFGPSRNPPSPTTTSAGVVRGPSGTRLEAIAPSNIYPTADPAAGW